MLCISNGLTQCSTVRALIVDCRRRAVHLRQQAPELSSLGTGEARSRTGRTTPHNAPCVGAGLARSRPAGQPEPSAALFRRACARRVGFCRPATGSHRHFRCRRCPPRGGRRATRHIHRHHRPRRHVKVKRPLRALHRDLTIRPTLYSTGTGPMGWSSPTPLFPISPNLSDQIGSARS